MKNSISNANNSRELILSGNLAKAILTLAIPVVINSFLQTMYNLTDTYWLGKLGTNELAAINLITPLQNIIVNFGAGLTVAAAVLIAQYLGAKEDEQARSMANQVYSVSIIFAVVTAALCVVLTPNIVGWLGAEGEIYDLAKIYMQLVIIDMPFLFTVNMYQSINQAQGDTLRPMLLNLAGIVINMIADPLLMIVLNMGIKGAALATVGSKAIIAVVAFILLNRKGGKLVYLELSKLKFEKEKLKRIVVVGLPTAIGGSTMQLGFLLMSKNVLVYGNQAMAAYGIGNKVNGLISLPANGVGSAVSTIVGQNIGANNYNRAEKSYKLSMIGCVIFLFVGGMILSRPAISTAIVSIFSSDPDVVGMAADFLSVMAFWCFANGVHTTSSGLFQGTGHTEVTMAIEITRLWVFRFATLYICETFLKMGVRSIWYSVVVSNGIAAAILFAIYLTGYWKKKRIKTKETNQL